MTKALLIQILLLLGIYTYGQSYQLDGTIKDRETNEVLVNANLLFDRSAEGSVSDRDGHFSVVLNAGKQKIKVSYVGYQTTTIPLTLRSDTSIVIYLTPYAPLEAVEIQEARQTNVVERTQMSSNRLTAKEIEQIPALLGEQDALKALQLLPGVQAGQEGQSNFFVRGGNADQNLILLDGVPLYNPFHLFGFLSVFNSDVIEEVNLLKGGFPARYGGRLASVIEVNTKKRQTEKWKHRASIGLIASKIATQGNLNERTSLLAAARYSYADIAFAPILAESFSRNGIDGSLRNSIYDLNLKLSHRVNEKTQLEVGSYFGRDRYGRREKREREGNIFENIDRLSWQNALAYVGWQQKWNKYLSSESKLYFTHYWLNNRDAASTDLTASSGVKNVSEYDLSYQAAVQDVALKSDFSYDRWEKHHIRFGGAVIQHFFKPGNFSQYAFIDNQQLGIFFEQDTTTIQNEVRPLETAWYVEDELTLNDRWSINGGLHFSTYHVAGKNYFSLQPRLASRIKLARTVAFKTSFAQMRQYIHLLTNPGIGLPTDLWLPATANILPQDGWQAAAGFAGQIGQTYEWGVEGYYKEMHNVLSYRAGAGLFDTRDWEAQVTQGKGWAYGTEFLFRKNVGRWTGWLSYTLSWSWRQFDDLNEGERFPFRYDRRHDIAITGSYQLNDRMRLSANWVYFTGNSVTLASGFYTTGWDRRLSGWSGNRFIDIYDGKNSFRLPEYHRLDIAFDWSKQKKRFFRIWSFGLYNVYNNLNPFYLRRLSSVKTPEGSVITTLESKVEAIGLFPIIPSISYKIVM
ncbi:MAG: TonB-dependent receptor [Bacteroidota bacterium]